MMGLGSGARLKISAALAFCAATFNAIADRKAKQMAILKGGGALPNDPTSGRYHYRGGPGTASVKRAALKRRNVLRHRRAQRG